MSSFLRDVRYAVRSLVKSPASTVVAVTTLALGIGPGTIPAALVNRAMASLYWPGESPVGKRIASGQPANAFRLPASSAPRGAGRSGHGPAAGLTPPGAPCPLG